MTALVAAVVFDADTVAVGAIVVAASLEVFVGLCLGCAVFGQLIRIGLVPSSVCAACDDLSGSTGG